MKAEIKPTENGERLRENLEKQVQEIRKDGEKLEVEVEQAEKLSRVPGVESYIIDGEKRQGLGGKPVREEAYAVLESKEDAVKALLATIEGYNLVILDTEREWDLRKLRKYNPEIIQLKHDEPKEELGIEKAVSEIDGKEKIDIEMPEEEEVELIYREMLT